jgi:hypothetical protein
MSLGIHSRLKGIIGRPKLHQGKIDCGKTFGMNASQSFMKAYARPW